MAKSVKFKQWDCFLKVGMYGNGRVALTLQDVYTCHPVAHCTLNLHDDRLAYDEIAIKNYAENEGMLEALISAGVVTQPHRVETIDYYPGNSIEIPICTLIAGCFDSDVQPSEPAATTEPVKESS